MHISHDFSSPNYNQRPADSSIDLIILHYTEMLFDEALSRLCDPASEVSCHYLIREDGGIFQLVSDEMRAWHAGKSSWHGREALNDCSIGIEIDNLGIGAFSDVQMESCVSLCKLLVNKHGILARNVIGHSDIAPRRKIDPGIYFDWGRLAGHGLGIYSDKHSSVINEKSSQKVKFDIEVVQKKLMTLGYDLTITKEWDDRTNSVIRAFQAHFCQETLRKKGLEFYRDMSNKYVWDSESDQALSKIYANFEIGGRCNLSVILS